MKHGLALRKECRLRIIENRNLRRISGPKRDEKEEWRRIDYEELHNLYHSCNVVRAIKYRILRWAGHVAKIEEGKSSFKILTGKPNRKLQKSS